MTSDDHPSDEAPKRVLRRCPVFVVRRDLDGRVHVAEYTAALVFDEPEIERPWESEFQRGLRQVFDRPRLIPNLDEIPPRPSRGARAIGRYQWSIGARRFIELSGVEKIENGAAPSSMWIVEVRPETIELEVRSRFARTNIWRALDRQTYNATAHDSVAPVDHLLSTARWKQDGGVEINNENGSAKKEAEPQD